jgi:Cytidylate kinase-like family
MPASIEAIIDRQLRRWENERRLARAANNVREPAPVSHPIITVSREHGSRGREVAARLADQFQYTLLHRNAIERISESTGYTQRLLEVLDEHARSRLEGWLDSLLWGDCLDESDYAKGLFKTVRSIASLGGVVVVGRGANFIVGPDRGVHVRVVAPFEDRSANLMRRKNLSRTDAEREIRAVDAERAKFVRKLFGRSVSDPLAYDITVNESGRPLDELVEILAQVARTKIERLRGTAAPMAV